MEPLEEKEKIKKGDLVIWRINPAHIGLILEKVSGSISSKSRVYWITENTKIVQFDQDLEILYENSGSK